LFYVYANDVCFSEKQILSEYFPFFGLQRYNKLGSWKNYSSPGKYGLKKLRITEMPYKYFFVDNLKH